MAKKTEIKKSQIDSGRSLLKSVLNNINDAIFIHDLKGRFLLVNAESCSRLEYKEEELLKFGLAKIDSPKFAKLVPARIKELKEKKSVVFESEHITKSGKTIPVEISSKVIDYQGKLAILSVARDITAQKNIENGIKEKFEELEKINRLMVGRELKMIKLKEKIQRLEQSLTK